LSLAFTIAVNYIAEQYLPFGLWPSHSFFLTHYIHFRIAGHCFGKLSHHQPQIPLLQFKMQFSSLVLAAASSLVTSVFAHGRITSPTARLAGSAMKAACGTQVYNNQASDSYGNIQGELQVAASQTDYNADECNIWQCKGFKYADNTANVQSWTAGQVVNFKFDVRAPHTGTANVSIVNTASNSIIGDILIMYDDFADNSKTIPTNNTAFSITVPSGLESTCSTAGACVLQHWWNAASIDQTYESCVDFTVGGSSSSGSSSAASSTAVTSAVASSSTSAAVSSSAAAKAVTTSSSSVAASTTAVPTTLQTIASSKASTSPPVAATSAAVAAADGDDEC
jgi:hypothetical protein